MTQPLFELTAHTQPASWYRDLPVPKKFDASNSVSCQNCGQILAYTWKATQYSVTPITCFMDIWKETQRCL